MTDSTGVVFKKTAFSGLFKITIDGGDELHFALVNLDVSNIVKAVCTPVIAMDMSTNPCYTLSIYTKDGGITEPMVHLEKVAPEVCQQIFRDIGLIQD